MPDSSTIARSEFSSVKSIKEGGAIVKLDAFEFPFELETVTAARPGDDTSAAEMTPVNCADDIKVVGRLAPFHRTIESLRKWLPVTVNTIASLPASIELGMRDVICGGRGLMVNVAAFDTPAGPETVTSADPVCAMSAAEIAVDSWVDEIRVVGRFELFHCTTELSLNRSPFTTSVNAFLPTSALAGAKLLITGASTLLITVKLSTIRPLTSLK